MTLSAANEPLLTPEFMSRLDQLSLLSRKVFLGKLRGERISKRRGNSVEFADHRAYVEGDDLRFLDWNIYARLERLFLKMFLEEEDLHVSILIDASKSMNCGTPAKSLFARRLAAAIAYIGLVNQDRVSLYGFGNELSHRLSGARGRRYAPKVMQFLSSLPAEGPGNMVLACRQFALHNPHKGIVLIVSDFLDKRGYAEGLRFLVGRKYDAYAVQVLCPEEIEPPLVGDLRLTDCEDGDVAEVTITPALLQRYQNNLRAYCEGLRDFCVRRGVNYLFAATDTPLDQMILSYFRVRGLLQ